MQQLFQTNMSFNFLAVILQKYAASNSLQTFITTILAGVCVCVTYFIVARNFFFSYIIAFISKVIIFHLNDLEAHPFR